MYQDFDTDCRLFTTSLFFNARNREKVGEQNKCEAQGVGVGSERGERKKNREAVDILE